MKTQSSTSSNINERLSHSLVTWGNSKSNYQTFKEMRYETRKKQIKKESPYQFQMPKVSQRIKTGDGLKQKYMLNPEENNFKTLINTTNYKDMNENQLINMKHSSFRPQRILHLAKKDSLRRAYNENKKLSQRKRDEPDNINYSQLIQLKDAEINKLLSNPNNMKGRNIQRSALLRTNYTTTGNQCDLNNSIMNNSNSNRSNTNRIDPHEARDYIQYLKRINKHPDYLLQMIKEGKLKSSKRNKTIINNKYIDELIKRVTRRVDYISPNNQIISEDEVMNLLKEESVKINMHVDKLMMATCFIKNFSLAFKQENEFLLLPLINSILPYENHTINTDASSINRNNNRRNTWEIKQEADYIQTIESVLFKGFKLKSSLMPINEKRDDELKKSESLASLFNQEQDQYQSKRGTMAEKEKPSIPTKYSSNKAGLMMMLVDKQSKSLPKRKQTSFGKKRRRSHMNFYCKMRREIITRGLSEFLTHSPSEKVILSPKNQFLLTQKTKSDLNKISFNKGNSFESLTRSRKSGRNKDNENTPIHQNSNFYKDNEKESEKKDDLLGDEMKKKLFQYKNKIHKEIEKEKKIKNSKKTNNKHKKVSQIEILQEEESEDDESRYDDYSETRSQIDELSIENDERYYTKAKKAKPNHIKKIKTNNNKKTCRISVTDINEVIRNTKSISHQNNFNFKLDDSNSNSDRNRNSNSENEDIASNTEKQSKTKMKTKINNKGKNSPNQTVTLNMNKKRNSKMNKNKKKKKGKHGVIQEEQDNESNNNNNSSIKTSSTKDYLNKKHTNILKNNKDIKQGKPILKAFKRINEINNNQENNQLKYAERILNFENKNLEEDQSPESQRLFTVQPSLNPSINNNNTKTEPTTSEISLNLLKDEIFSLGITSQSEMKNITTNQLDQLMKNKNVLSQIEAFRSEIQKNPFRYIRRGQSLTDVDIIKLMLENITSASNYQRTTTKNMKTILQRLSSIKETAKDNMKQEKYQVMFEKMQMPSEFSKKDIAKKNYQTSIGDTSPFSLNTKTLDNMIKSGASHKIFLEYTKKSRLNEFNMHQELQYQIETAEGENGREKFKEFLNQLEHMKKMDGGGYINSLEQHYDNIRDEIDGLVQAKEMEERINRFLSAFSKTRTLTNVKRNILNSKIKVKDHKFDVFMSNADELYNLNEDN